MEEVRVFIWLSKMKLGTGSAARAHLLMVAVAILLLPVMVVQATPLAPAHPAHFQTLPCLLPECEARGLLLALLAFSGKVCGHKRGTTSAFFFL